MVFVCHFTPWYDFFLFILLIEALTAVEFVLEQQGLHRNSYVRTTQEISGNCVIQEHEKMCDAEARVSANLGFCGACFPPADSFILFVQSTALLGQFHSLWSSSPARKTAVLLR